MRKLFSTFILLLFVVSCSSTESPELGLSTQGAVSCPTRDNNNFNKLLQCVTPGGVREHQAAFQAIADANGGTRSSSRLAGL